ncbi:MAG: hypothetical protein IIB21_06935 [Chloroflexi bacterium]|nr:hypothetical protein [Chloroflexota bacterium]
MPIPGLSPEKCRQRNRIAAKRYGLNTASITLLKHEPSVAPNRLSSTGSLPASDEEALALINALLPESAEPLELEQVWIHYAEAANTNFIPDRYMFLHESTLKNVAEDAAKYTGRWVRNRRWRPGCAATSRMAIGW